jgi:hypothetical protein
VILETVHLAETSDGQIIVVKFARQDCPELHDICAASGHAPALLGYERLPGGWYGIAMEYVVNAVPITLHEQIPVHFQRWKKDLQRSFQNFIVEAWFMATYVMQTSLMETTVAGSSLTLTAEGKMARCRILRPILTQS